MNKTCDKYDILKSYEINLMYIMDIIGSSTTNNIQLDSIGKYLLGKNYLGTFSSDKFPKNIKNENCFILNNKSSKEAGEHFISVYKRNGKLYGYDTYNRPIKSLSKFWLDKKIINANEDRDESMTEKNCGSRAMAWILSFFIMDHVLYQ